MKQISLLSFTVLLAAASAFGAEISREDLKKALDKNPDLVLDVLRSHKKDFFDIILQAQQEEQGRRQKEAAEQEQKEMDEAFKSPKKAAVDKNSHVRGSKDAKYLLVEYSDFQCPYCSKGFQTVEDLRKKYGEKLRFVFKNKPLPFHPQAMPAAQYFEAISLQSAEKAWDFHDKLFRNQDKLGEPFFKETAKASGVDMAKLENDVKSKAVQDRINADIEEAEKLGFSGTPGFLLNGVPIKGAYPIESFDSIIARIDQEKK